MGKIKTIRMADGSRSDAFKPYREGHVDVTVSVPIEKFKTAYDFAVTQGWIDQDLVSEGSLDEDDMRVTFATLVTVMNAAPINTSGLTKMLLDCRDDEDVKAVVERHFAALKRSV